MDRHHHPHKSDGRGSGLHQQAPAKFGRAFALGILLNTAFVVIEAGYGWLGNSMALVADAGHNLSDVLGLIVAWIASVLVKRRPSARFTYGLQGSSILAALFNAVFLLIATGGITVEALRRFAESAQVEGTTVTIVAGIGILINGFTAWLFASGRERDINIRGAYLHMLADAAVSAGVVAAGLVILLTGFNWIDPLVSLAIAALIVVASWALLRDSVGMALSAVPPGVDPKAVRYFLARRSGVKALHDLHIWPMSTTEIALTAHLVTSAETLPKDFLRQTADELFARFGIGHVTLQVEIEGETLCTLPAECVA